MTGNEKRAHDLAILLYKDIYDAKVNTAAKDAVAKGQLKSEIHIDIYQIYKELYDKNLHLLNSDYPEMK